jgi:hypothetical protein
MNAKKIGEVHSMSIQREHALSTGIENLQDTFCCLHVTESTNDAKLLEARMLGVTSSRFMRQNKKTSSSVDKRNNSDTMLLRIFNGCQKLCSSLRKVMRSKTNMEACMEAEIIHLPAIRPKST